MKEGEKREELCVKGGGLVMLGFRRQLPARDVLENLPIFRCQTRASFRSRAARACALLASLSLLCVN